MSKIDRTELFSDLRTTFGPLKQSQVNGINFIIDNFERAGLTDPRWLAYMLATAWHETARTMLPITEYGSQAYLRGKKYWPYIGRGYVQLTWEANYKRYGIADNPEKALDPDFAAHIMIDGMTKGVFTGKSLKDYFSASKDDPVGARRIINGTDKATLISNYHRAFLKAIQKSI